MQKRPLLLSSANSYAAKEKPHLSMGGIFLIVVCGFFVVYGAIDLGNRFIALFSSNETSATPQVVETVTGQHQGVLPPATSTQTVSSVAPKPSVTGAFTPSRLQIPSLSINASVQQVGLTAEGAMASPKGFSDVGWYKYGSKPGEAGNTVIAGHLNNALGLSGVFEQLGTIAIGSEITVSGNGQELHYKVTELDVYGTGQAPSEAIFSTSGPSKLVLITCDGAWDAGVKSYNKRLVVIAERI